MIILLESFVSLANNIGIKIILTPKNYSVTEIYW